MQATNIHQSFGSVEALRGVNLTLMPGEIVAILGVNGAGKSTFIDIVLGLATPTSGEISVYGMSPREAVRRSLVGAMLQTGSMPRDGKVGYTIDLVASMHANPIPTDELLERTNLTKLAKRPLNKLSGGERQRVRLALALAGNPDFLILDEPTAGMDVNARRHFWEAMHAEAEGGTTIIFATHYLAEAEAFAPRTIIMNRGKIVADGGTAQIRHNFGTQHINLTFDTQESLSAASAHMARRATVSRSADTLSISGPDTVALVREVIAFPGISSISITDQSLEEAFEQLTDVGDEAAVSPKES